MSASRILTPAPGAIACFNCTAWHPWGDMAVGRETAGGYTVIGRRPSGQCRAKTPTIDPNAICAENATWPVVNAENWCRQFELHGDCGVAA